MDDKIRISFYPKDTSRVRALAASRRVLIGMACVAVPLATLGVWLALTGSLHEPDRTSALRKKLHEENRALQARVGQLDKDLHGLRGELTRLEEQKVNALLITGVEYMENGREQKSSGLFSFLRGSAGRPDPDAALAKARFLAASLDSTLALLHSRSDLVEGLPTALPASPAALNTRGFGYSPDPFTGRKALHAGVDFSQQAGAPVYAAGGGTVASIEKDLMWGNCLRIDHGRRVETFYAHLQDITVKRGQRVVRGQAVGTMGMTGVATGAHLHFELNVRGSKIDPMAFFLPELRLFAGADAAAGGI
jgi:murein DD-endopeptidase MepM/ murein hydrolase activator NlpD